MKARLTLATIVALSLLYVLIILNPQNASAGQPQGGSQLQIIGKDGKPAGFVPLKHTGIKTEISGFVARVEVTQEFENVLPDAVEAIYVFPLPHDSAVKVENSAQMRTSDCSLSLQNVPHDTIREIGALARMFISQGADYFCGLPAAPARSGQE